jgi:hypothetical protein
MLISKRGFSLKGKMFHCQRQQYATPEGPSDTLGQAGLSHNDPFSPFSREIFMEGFGLYYSSIGMGRILTFTSMAHFLTGIPNLDTE